jgi:hypothetical protein
MGRQIPEPNSIMPPIESICIHGNRVATVNGRVEGLEALRPLPIRTCAACGYTDKCYYALRHMRTDRALRCICTSLYLLGDCPSSACSSGEILSPQLSPYRSVDSDAAEFPVPCPLYTPPPPPPPVTVLRDLHSGLVHPSAPPPGPIPLFQPWRPFSPPVRKLLLSHLLSRHLPGPSRALPGSPQAIRVIHPLSSMMRLHLLRFSCSLRVFGVAIASPPLQCSGHLFPRFSASIPCVSTLASPPAIHHRSSAS